MLLTERSAQAKAWQCAVCVYMCMCVCVHTCVYCVYVCVSVRVWVGGQAQILELQGKSHSWSPLSSACPPTPPPRPEAWSS